jgi:hypothetical protein
MRPRERMAVTMRVLDAQIPYWSARGRLPEGHSIFKRMIKLGLIEVTRKPYGMKQLDSNKRNHWQVTAKGRWFLLTGSMTFDKPVPRSERRETGDLRCDAS